MKRFLAILLGLTLLLGAIPAMAGGKTFTYGGVLENLDLLDGHKSTVTDVLNAGVMICEPLLALQPDGSLEPQLLAEMPVVNEEGTFFACKLREDVYFHDGTQLTSADVYFTLRRIFDPATANVNAWLCDMIKGGQAMLDGEADELEGVKIIDDFNFTIELEYPYAPFAYVLSCPQMIIYPQAATIAAGERWGVDTFIGTGPYKLVEFSAKDVLHLKANDDYYEGRPALDEVFWLNLDQGTALMEFEAGTLDLCGVDPAYVQGYLGEEFADNLIKIELMGVIALNLNTSMAPLDNPKVREALSYAIDNNGLVEAYLQGNGTPTDSIVPPGIVGHADREPVYDPEKAKALLAEAGYPDGITLVNYVSESSSIAGVPVVLQEQLKASGITLEVNRVDAATYIDLRKSGSVQCPILTWYGDVPDPDNFLYTFYQSDNSSFFSSCWKDAKTDEMLMQGRALPSGEERAELYKALEHYLVKEQCIVVPLYNPVTYYLQAKGVGGVFFDNSMFHLDDATKE